VATVEGELLAALHKWGAISEDNAVDPSKVGWQRASRTDKGVHAIGATVSAKLLLSDEQLEDTPAGAGERGSKTKAPAEMVTAVTAPELSRLNALLPAQIRVHAIQRVRSSFDAYKQCSARRYQYLLPESALGPGGPEQLDAILRMYTGTHAFHNFAAGVRTHSAPLAPAPAPSAAHTDGSDAAGSELGESPLAAESLGWPLAVDPFRPASIAFRTVLRCELAPEAVTVSDGTRYHAVLIHGRSFVLHQVRPGPGPGPGPGLGPGPGPSPGPGPGPASDERWQRLGLGQGWVRVRVRVGCG
jgi:tRNA pseudouridine(38-40) synthase